MISDVTERVTCPHCGGLKFSRVDLLTVKGETLWIVRCVRCGYELVISYSLDLKVV